MAAKDATTLEVPGPGGAREVRISSPGRELWPGTGITKLRAGRVLRHGGALVRADLGHRPITLQRFPDGDRRRGVLLEEPAARRSRLRAHRHPDLPARPQHPQLVLDELAAAVWAVQMNTITFHPWPVRTASDTDNPDELRIDLDPQPGRDFHDAAAAALELRACSRDGPDRLGEDLRQPRRPRVTPGSSRPTSSSTSGTGSSHRPRAGAAAPELVTMAWWKEERGEKVFVDFNQANRDRTIASAWSPRP